MLAADCTPGLAVIYRPHPGAPAEDGVIVRRRHDLVMVTYSNGPEAGKTCATHPGDLEPAHP